MQASYAWDGFVDDGGASVYQLYKTAGNSGKEQTGLVVEHDEGWLASRKVADDRLFNDLQAALEWVDPDRSAPLPPLNRNDLPRVGTEEILTRRMSDGSTPPAG